MKKRFLFLLTMSLIAFEAMSQVQIFYENFGTNSFFRNDANKYNEYSSDKNMFSSDIISIHNWDAEQNSNYEGASGNSFVWLGRVSTDPITDIPFMHISGINTSEFSKIQLSFGCATWHGATSDYIEIHYSIDGTTWTPMDATNLADGEYVSGNWGWVQLAEELPATTDLHIKIHVTSLEQSVRFDDVRVTGFSSDSNPPTQPGNLSASAITYNSFSLSWIASTDDNEVSHYSIFQDGAWVTTTTTTTVQLDYLMPNQTATYTVVAYDMANNASQASEGVEVATESLPEGFQYSWQKPHAKVIETGDLEWQPEPFVFEKGISVRYIDFENGSDKNDGLSPENPWKHHPWDSKATENAAGCTGIHTYIFKRGVVYRGTLEAKESGTTNDPIRLTSDPDWGTGEAAIYGSRQFNEGWQKADADIAPNIPEPEKVWYLDVWLPETKVVCQVNGDEIKRVHLARIPNYQHTPDDPLKTWWAWSRKQYDDDAKKLWLTDRVNFTQSNPDFYKGGTVRSQEDAIVMCTVWEQTIQEYLPDEQKISVTNENFGGARCHYFIENTPFLLDTTNEFYYDKENNRMFLRLDEDKDPNTTTIEAATESQLLEIDNKHNIVISGLTFGFTTANKVRFGYRDCISAIRITGTCSNIELKNNVFRYVNGGITSQNGASQTSHHITVSDNDFQVVDDLAIVFASNNEMYYEDMYLYRNRIYNNGARQLGRWYTSVPAMFGEFTSGEVAGNIVDVSWGNGLDFFWGKSGSSNKYIPFIRGLVHHNKASNTLIGTNDYGGIESWQGGPTYYFNNVSHNASGYKHYNNTSLGLAFYFDGCFKHSVFNNIASGVSKQRNEASYMQVLGLYNMYVHNTGYNTEIFFNGGSRNLALNGHNAYLANIGDNIETFFRHELDEAVIPFDAYGYNIMSNCDFRGTLESKSKELDYDEFVEKLESYDSHIMQLGWEAGKPVFSNIEQYDFKPAQTGEAIDRGVKFFTAFPLYAVVGEWHFYKHPADLSIIMSENFYMTSEYSDRTKYKDVPKNHLKAHNVSEENFVTGDLENWTEGALVFDGQSTYCSIDHNAASQTICDNIDMTTNNFTLEIYLKTEENHTGSAILSKFKDGNGYEVRIDGNGKIQVRLMVANAEAVSRTSSETVNNGQWHHIVAEINRKGTIAIYIDGKLSNGELTGIMPGEEISLTNTSDFLVGTDHADAYFYGLIDFLRISKGLLYDAKTTVDELHTWMTDGPFLYDFAGQAPIGKRDAGAIEAGEKTCELSISSEKLEFNYEGGSDEIIVNQPDNFELLESTGNFYSFSISDNTFALEAYENTTPVIRDGEMHIFGCNETKAVYISQDAAPCVFIYEPTKMEAASEGETFAYALTTNGDITLRRSGRFFKPDFSDNRDTLYIIFEENTSSEERTGTLYVDNCAGTHEVQMIQQGTGTDINKLNKNGIDIYPNPVTNDKIHITIPQIRTKHKLTITDLNGKVIENHNIYHQKQTITLKASEGMYLLHVTGNEIMLRTKIVVQ